MSELAEVPEPCGKRLEQPQACATGSPRPPLQPCTTQA